VRLQRLRLKNWRQIRALDVEFGDFTIIRGPNGVGKTNMVEAIVFALVGSGDEEDICQLAGDESAEVSLWFTHKEEQCRIERSISRRSRQTAVLHKPSGNVNGIRNVKETVLQDILRIDESMVRRYLFVKQWDIFAFINDRDADRAAAFSRLFGTEKAAKIWKLLGDYKLPDAPITIDGQAVEERLRFLAGAISEAEAAKDVCSKKVALLTADRESRERLVRDYLRCGPRQTDLARARAAIQEATAAYDCANQAIPGLREEAERARAAESAASSAAGQAYVALAEWCDYDHWLNAFSRASSELTAAKTALQALQDVPAPDNLVAAADIAARTKDLRAGEVQVAVLLNLLQSIDPARGVAACPTCATPVASLMDRIEAAREALPKWQRFVVEWTKALAASEAYYRASSIRDADRKAAASRVAAAETALAALGTKATPTTPRAGLAEAAVAARAATARREEPERLLRQAESDLAKASARVTAEAERAMAIEVELKELAYATKEAYDRAVAAEVELRDAASAAAAAEAKLTILRLDREAAEGLLKSFHEQRRQYWITRNLREHAEKLREQFHHEALPAAVHKFCLERITARIDRVLAVFNKPYRVDSISGTRFILRFADGRLHGEGLLSGGEKVIFAVAFRFATNTTFAEDLGILFLDEPTAGLDDEAVHRLHDAFQELRDVSRASGLQLGLITHERGFDAPCDKVIDLAAELSNVDSGIGPEQRENAAG